MKLLTMKLLDEIADYEIADMKLVTMKLLDESLI